MFDFFNVHRFLTSSLDLLLKRLFESNHKTQENLKEEIVGGDFFLNFFNGMGTLNSKDRYKKNYIEGLKKVFQINLKTWKSRISFNHLDIGKWS